MLDGESIDMLTQFTSITNGLVSLSKPIDNDQKVWKIIKALPKSWEVKVTTLKKLDDNKKIDVTAFVKNLKTHEMKMKTRRS